MASFPCCAKINYINKDNTIKRGGERQCRDTHIQHLLEGECEGLGGPRQRRGEWWLEALAVLQVCVGVVGCVWGGWVLQVVIMVVGTEALPTGHL